MVPKNGLKSWKALNKFYSKELNLEEIYRGESAEKLKKNLKDIQKQIEEFDFSLNNSVDLVKLYCANLRNEVDLEAEIAIKRIQDIRDEMIKEIDTYQANCISNLEAEKIQKEGFNGFIDELRSFHKEWSEYLKKYQINDVEINNVNNLVLELNQRFKKEKVNLDKFIFNKKSITFRKSETKIEKTFLGNFEFKTIGAIDFNQFQEVKFADILNNFSNSKDFDLFEKDKIVVAYPELSHIVVAIIDKNREITNSSQTSLEYYHGNCYQLKIKKAKDVLAVYYGSPDYYAGKYHFALINSKLEVIKKTLFSDPAVFLDGNDTNIYCLTQQSCISNYKMTIFDHQLNYLRVVGQDHSMEQAFYLSNNITQLTGKNNNFFCLYSNKLDIIDESTGVLLKSILIQANKMAFDSKNNLLVLSVSSSKIYKYNLDGVLQDEIDYENILQGIELSILEGDKISFFNKSSKSIYFE